jgi:hypothetical protein
VSRDRSAVSPSRQPKGVWAVAFACVVSFMGIGLVDPMPMGSNDGANKSAAETIAHRLKPVQPLA